jgi:type IV pilus assembly protein PilV
MLISGSACERTGRRASKSSASTAGRERGFSLVEVMVALIVTAIGLLGLAKMESLALASTSVASMRSLVAIEAGSMVASMHANRDYWASASATTGATITGSAPTVSDAVLAAASNCYNNAVPCTPSAMAAFDVRNWGSTLNNMIPGYSASIVCTQPVTPLVTPVTCTISITWVETAVAVNAQQVGITPGTFTAAQTPTYTLIVEP